MIKTLWVMVQGDPVFMRRVNGWLAVLWVAMIPVSLITHWVESVVYVSALSLWALVSGHWSAWQAARVEVKQDDGPDMTEPPEWWSQGAQVMARLNQVLVTLEQRLSEIK